MSVNGSVSASTALQLPINLHGIQLGRPIDVLLDADSWNMLGSVVRGGDGSQRFLPLAGAQLTHEEIAVGSALCCSRTSASTPRAERRSAVFSAARCSTRDARKVVCATSCSSAARS